jgi:hypothetical protein
MVRGKPMAEEIITTDLDFLMDLIEDFGLRSTDKIGDLIAALEEEEHLWREL